MHIEFEFEAKLRQLHFFNLEDGAAAYQESPPKGFRAYMPSNPEIFEIGQKRVWPRTKKLELDDQCPPVVSAVELWIFSLGVVAVSMEMEHKGSTTDLKNLSLEVKADQKLKAYAETLVRSEFEERDCERFGDDDHQYIQIAQPLKESMLDEKYQDITAILTGDDEQFSDHYIEEILDNTVPYTHNSYAYVGSRCLIQVHNKIDDLFCLWMFQLAYANKIPAIESFLNERLQRTFQLLSRPRSFLPVPAFSHDELQEANPYDEKTLQTAEQFSTPLEIAGVGFFSQANETIRDVLDLGAWHGSVKEKYDDLEGSYEHLENLYSLKSQEMMEWLIILAIIVTGWLALIVA